MRYDFDRIINKYIDALVLNRKRDSKFNYLIDYDRTKEKLVIDFIFLIDILKELQENEGSNLQKIYISQYYYNYDKLKKVLGADQTNFTSVMIKFLDNLREFNKLITKKVEPKEIIKIFDESFIKKLQKLTELSSNSNIQFIEAYAKYFNKTNKLPYVRVLFKKYHRNLHDDFHRTKLENSVKKVDKSWKITKYDKEAYAFNNMLDEYTKKLNNEPIDLGYVWVDPETYQWKTEKIIEGVERYYKEFFNIEDIDIESHKMSNLLADYLEGLIWVFEFYYNKLNNQYNQDHADTWYYKWPKAPLLTQLFRFMKLKASQDQDYLEKLSDGLAKYSVDRAIYFKPLEHMMYVVPVHQYPELVPKEYDTFIKNKKYFPNMKQYASKVLEGESKIINCRGVIFLNKCELALESWDWTQDKKFLEDIRRIKLSQATQKRNIIN